MCRLLHKFTLLSTFKSETEFQIASGFRLEQILSEVTSDKNISIRIPIADNIQKYSVISVTQNKEGRSITVSKRA